MPKVFEVIVGLEIHAQILSQRKLFSYGTAQKFGSLANTNVDLFDAAIPGTLPVINPECVNLALRTILALDGKVNRISSFDRKHYFYPDLPHSFQITQQFHKIMTGGSLDNVDIESMHIETDSGASNHEVHRDYSLIDLNRAGCGLMEIVTKPTIRSADQAVSFLRKLQHLLRHIGTCSGNMEEGALRCDVNISVREAGSTEFGVRSEIKNLGSIKQVGQAITAEAKRHEQLLKKGLKVDGGTRLFDPVSLKTVLMRKKEEEADYRFFPEPDLPQLVVTDDDVRLAKDSLPELPWHTQARLERQYGMSAYNANVLVHEFGASSFFEQVMKIAAEKDALPPQKVSNLIITDLFGLLNKHSVEFIHSPVKVTDFYGIVADLHHNRITGPVAKAQLRSFFDKKSNAESKPAPQAQSGTVSSSPPSTVVVSDELVLKNLCTQVLETYPDEVKKYKAGRDRLMGFFVAEVIKSVKKNVGPNSNADPRIVASLFQSLLK